MDPLLADLNDAQIEAVRHRGGPLLVVAGAGSGKTRVITRRVAWLVRDGLADFQILAITFTNKAAAEMRERIAHSLGRNRATVSTFHSLGARILRVEAAAAGLDPNYTIFDDSDQVALMREVLKELGLGSRDHSPRDYLSLLSLCKNAGFTPESSDHPLVAEHARVFEVYEKALTANRAVDFDDLLLKTVLLFERDEDARRRFASRFRALLIDEYQDTNPLQYRLAKLIAPVEREICATGDPDQSIYAWRGADVRNILEFEKDFEGSRTILLEENYRSSNRILEAASAVIRNNRFRIERKLWSRLGDGEQLRLRRGGTDREEGRAITDGIRDARRDGFALDQIAVLYRTNACSRVLEQAMRDANLPYVIVGAVAFYDRREVKDLIAYLRVIANPADDVDFARVLNVPARGIGGKALETMRLEAQARGIPLSAVACEPEFAARLRTKSARQEMTRLAASIRAVRAMPRYPVAGILDRILDDVDYLEWLRSSPDPLLEERLENVEELRRAVRQYDAEHPEGSLEEFLGETVLVRSRDEVAEFGPRVTLMTLHSAKGLEFDVVFLAGLEEGLLPHSRSLENETGIEEERRLFYVGITRARKRLTLSYARSRFAPGNFQIPSRFIDEIPPELFDAPPPSRRQLATFAEPYYEPDPGSDEPPFEIGDRVVHERFGRGSVVELAGFGPAAKVTVDFDEAGRRKLVLEFARLRKGVS
jgi:DNA helicase-2/ATP-dependent DNA helicase PcrA